MDIAKALTRIDVLRARQFPVAHTRTDQGESGPGYHIAELETSDEFWEDDGTAHEETEEQYEADRDGLGERLAERWGPSQHISLYSTSHRAMNGEDVEEPWARLSGHVPDLHLWQDPESGRWIALGVSHWDEELAFQLLAVVTETDPP
ncbi:hypothetical protein [Streptomyces brasiliensis]|uniref:Uncharacterized protein n=1 Tax=Streptomyces brasiliensis TaxID=1954 RepID=A0A917NY17_9ACTN|nr:hypothetical protein [Streptomyces brasiliensis]GGJ39516.1 hypothetical protein GCM10010121_058280 [Streptomyces brasiliensis]